jgi:hypothetical protein
MRFLFCYLVFAALLSLPVAAQDRPDDLLKAAIAASGGEDVLTKYPAGRVIGKGTLIFGGSETAFTFEQAYHVPGRFRTLVRCEVKGQKWEMIQLLNDAVAKQTINGRPIPLSDAALKDLQMAAVLNEIGQLVPLTTDRKFTLKLNKQEKGMDTIGLFVQTRNHSDVQLAFDRKSGHLVRCTYRGVDPDTAKLVDLETSFEDFKTVSGLTRPMRSQVTREGKKIVEMQVEKFTPLEKVDPKAFTLDE